MNLRSLGALVVLNAVLLAALAVVTFAPAPAQAQLGAAGEYLMIPGFAQGRDNQEAVYIIETKTARMVAIFVNPRNEIELVGARDIAADVQAGPGRGR